MAGVVVSRQARQALEMLSTSIRVGRIRRGWTTGELAERLGVTRQTVHRIEHSPAGVAVATMFEAATLVGVALFGDDPVARERHAAERRNELALLPEAVRHPSDVNYDF